MVLLRQTGGKADPPDQNEAEAADDQGGEATDNPEVEAVFDAVSQRVGAADQMAMVEQIIRNGELDADTAERTARGLQSDGEGVSAMTATVIEGLTKQANASVEAFGLDAESVWEWAHQNASEDLDKAMRQQATERSVAGYKALAQTYIASLGETNPFAVLDADLGDGVDVKMQDGKLIVLADGASFTWKSAIQNGVIKVSRKRR